MGVPVGVIPDGCMDLIWDGDAVLLAGPDTRPHSVTVGGDDVVRGIRFDPGVLPGVLQVSARELTDQRVPLADVRPELARAVRESVLAGAALDDAVAAAAGEVAPPAWVAPTVRALVAGVPAERIAATLGLGERQLHRRATGVFGYGPKRLAVVLRATRALDELRAGTELSDTAACVGYADYSHMYRDIRRLTGRSPADFRPAAAPPAGPDQESGA